jgi:hypothetical protein
MENKFEYIINKKYYLLFFFLLYLTVLFGFYFDEDNLGGAMHDATYHYRISEEFNKNFYQTFLNFGTGDGDMGTRNSPVFWIFLSFLDEYISYDFIRFLNTLIIFAIAIVFYKCLLLKYKNIQPYTLIILSSFIFLSPSLRSLAIWPYSLIWGLFFFILSIYNYLKFKGNLNFYKSVIILINVIIAAYIYPAFSVFFIFFFYEITKQLKKSQIIGLILISVALAVPCVIYLITKDFFTSFDKAQGLHVPLSKSLNISNKILIISSIFFYFILPIINFKEIFFEIKKINPIKIIILMFFCFINIYYFNFPNDNWGGGFFHKVSNLFFNNNYLFFFSAFISILFIYAILEKKFKNYLLLAILIIYNPQLTIYLKYFDPLIFIIFLTLFDFDFKKHFVDKTYKYYQFYGVIIFYYIAVFAKKSLIPHSIYNLVY